MAGYLLKQYKEQFKGSKLVGIAKYFSKHMGSYVRDLNPVVVRMSSTQHLRSSEWQIQAFEYRTASILENCAMLINSNRKKMGFWNAWNDCVPQLKALTIAYSEQYMLEQFVEKIEKMTDAELKPVLKLVCDIFALQCMLKDVGGFFELLTKKKLDAISHLFEELCEDARDHALSLVDAFSIPDFLLEAPIGVSKGDYVQHVLNCSKKLNPNNHSFTVNESELNETHKRAKTNSNTQQAEEREVILNVTQ